MNKAKIKGARLAFEKKILTFIQDVENDKNGYNYNHMKHYFEKMTDNQFVEFVTKLANDEKFNLFFEASNMDEKHSPNLDRIEKLCEKYKVPTTEYITLPYKDNSDPDHPFVTQTEVPVIYCLIRPLQQMIDKKNAMSSNIESTNSLTGQVSGKSKVSTFSNMQYMSCVASNRTKVAKELLGPRADDYRAKEKMLTQIEMTGRYDLDDIDSKIEDKRSMGTVKAMLTAAGLDIAFEDQHTFKETYNIIENKLKK